MKENSIENLQNKKYFNNIDEAIKVYEEFRRFKNDGFIESIDTDFFFNLTDIILSDYKRVLKENEEIEEKDKIIQHMSKYILSLDIDKDICMKNTTNTELCNEDNSNCIECIIKHFSN